MLTVSKMGGGRAHYYTSLSKIDYYLGTAYELEQGGIWIGTGAERLGLSGARVETEAFTNLFHGYSADGQKKFVRNAGTYDHEKENFNRMPGLDLTFSAPKSVSIVWALAEKETRRALEKAHLEAIRETIAEIEKFTVIRTGAGGRVQQSCGLVVAVFQHGTARQVDENTLPDMQLHTHGCVINTGVTAEKKKTGAIKGVDFLNDTFAKQHGAMYRAHLASHLRGLGFALERTEEGWEIKGVAKEMREEFSKRSAQIEEAAPRETSSAKEKLNANKKTKMAKGELDPEMIVNHWRERGVAYGVTAQTVEELRSQKSEATAQEQPHREARTKAIKESYLAVSEAARELAEKKNYFTRAELITKAYEVAGPRGVSTTDARETIEDYLKKEALRFELRDGQRLYSTKDNEEAATRETAKKEWQRTERIGNLRAVEEAIKQEGKRVIICTLSKSQANSLQGEGINAHTVRSLQYDLSKKEPKTVSEKWEATKGTRNKIYAEYKYATHQWSKESKQKYLGEFYKPKSRLAHEVMYATHQISKKHRDYLNKELEREARKVDEKTVVVFDVSEKLRTSEDFQKVVKAVEAKGGRSIFVNSLTLQKLEQVQERVISKEKEIDKQQPEHPRQEQEKRDQAQRQRQRI
jgi:conjugative relaxase-like TrwC/TraI family protein